MVNYVSVYLLELQCLGLPHLIKGFNSNLRLTTVAVT